jgi:hypothetical protein
MINAGEGDVAEGGFQRGLLGEGQCCGCDGAQALFELDFRGLQMGPGVGGAGIEPCEQRLIQRGRPEPQEIGLKG